LAGLTKLLNPIAVRLDAILDQLIRQAYFSKVRAHPKGPLAPRRVKTDVTLHVAAIIQEFFGPQPLDRLADDCRIVTFIDQLPAQFFRCVVAARQRVEGRHAGGPGIERVYDRPYRLANQGVTLL
jgi:hypothetical protein